MSEPTLPDIQEEVVDLEVVKVLDKRTRGGSSKAASPPNPKVQKKAKKNIRQMVVSKYTEEEVAEVEASSLVTRKRIKKVVAETPSNSQTNTKFVAAESLQNQGSQEAQEAVVIVKAKEIAKKLGSSVAHIVKKKDVEDAQKAMKFTKEIQNTVGKEVNEMLKTKMQVKREQGCSEAGPAAGNFFHNTLSYTIDLDPLSPTHNNANLDEVPLSRVYSNLEKALLPHHLPNLSLSLMMIRLKSQIHSF